VLISLVYFPAIPELNKDVKTKATLETIKALNEDERSIKTLLTNDSLHQYRLLDPARFVIRGAPSIPSPQVDVTTVPIQTKDSTSSKSIAEPPLIRCSETSAVELPKQALLTPIVEEGEGLSHSADKAPAEMEKETEEVRPTEEEQLNLTESNIDPAHQTEQGGGESSTFHGLTDLMDTSRDFITDDSTTSRLNAPATSIIPSSSIIPLAKDPSSTQKAPESSQPKSKSGS